MGQLRTANKRHNRALARAQQVASNETAATKPTAETKAAKA